MNVHTVWWLMFLLVKEFSSTRINTFVLEKHELTATEGSCIEITCKGEDKPFLDYDENKWFGMKDAFWDEKFGDFNGTIVYSKLPSRSVSPLFEGRVHLIVNSSESGTIKVYTIRICNLTKADSGNYSFRYDKKWKTKPEANLTVVGNPCPITFENPPVVVENHVVNITCSTLSSCPSILTIHPAIQPVSTDRNMTSTRITHSFQTNWTHDGVEFSCQTLDNKDKDLVRKVTLTVEYAPRDVTAVTSHINVTEGDSLTLTCSGRWQPNVTFQWFKNNKTLELSHSEIKFTPANDSHSGLYYCVAQNKHGSQQSNTLNITVLYAPEVKVEGLHNNIKEGETISLYCNVTRSEPPPTSFVWLKNGQRIATVQNYVFNSITPTDSGSYRCSATNTVGSGTSQSSDLRVHYKPRSHVSIHGDVKNNEVSVNSAITFTCDTIAYPEPWYYSWFFYNLSNPSHMEYTSKKVKSFSLKSVQRAHEGCYTCNTSNNVAAGDASKPKCIRIRFPPTNLKLIMDKKVREGNSITVSCSTESFPPSNFEFKWFCPQSQNWKVISKSELPNNHNIFNYSFIASSANAGSYMCIASNSENITQSQQMQLVVEYLPKDVTILPSHELIVNEKASFSLECTANSNPAVKLFTWIKDNSPLNKNMQKYSVRSASPSDSGLYNCSADNEIGTGRSKHIEVKVKYAPKQTTIIREFPLASDTRYVKLICNSASYPPANYSWYSKTKRLLSREQIWRVSSDKAEECYCVAENEMGKKSSDPIVPFPNNRRILLFGVLSFLFILLFIILLYRYKRKRLTQQRPGNTWSCGSFLAWWTRAKGRNTVSEMGLVEPSRSRDVLLIVPPRSPNARQRQPHPDVTSESNINTVYCTVKPTHQNQAPSAQKPARQQGGHTEDDSLNYASLHFQKKQKKPEEDPIYTKVSKPKSKPSEENKGGLIEYENISPVHTDKPSNHYESDTDTSSEDEEEINYVLANIRQQRARRNSSSSEDPTEYSQVKI